VTNEAGGLVARHDFFPFGDEISPMADDTTKMFTGHERDRETGLDYMFARYYGGSLPRFLSPDPIGGNTAAPQSWNRYAYVRNNPLNLTDPTGLYGINPNPYNPEGTSPCDGMGPMCKYDKTGKKEKKKAKKWIKKNVTNKAERRRLLGILKNASKNPHLINTIIAQEARMKIGQAGQPLTADNQTPGPGELIVTGDPSSVAALQQARGVQGSDTRLIYGDSDANVDASTGRMVDATVTIFEGSHQVAPYNAGYSLADDMSTTFIHESAHSMGPVFLPREIDIYPWVGGTPAQ